MIICQTVIPLPYEGRGKGRVGTLQKGSNLPLTPSFIRRGNPFDTKSSGLLIIVYPYKL